MTRLLEFLVAVSAVLLVSPHLSHAAQASRKSKSTIKPSTAATASQTEVQTRRKALIERMKASRQKLNESLPQYETKLAHQTAEFERKQKLYDQDLVSQADLDNCERDLTKLKLETERIRNRIADGDLAISLAVGNASRETVSFKNLVPGTYGKRKGLISYNGTGSWSIADISKVAKFYRARFGRQLPITAMGQSSTHDRMGLDHRDAVDVGVSPASVEGRSLMAYLRKARIPFLAFRGKVPGMATGPHIHIGPPSARLMEVQQRSIQPVESEDNTGGG